MIAHDNTKKKENGMNLYNIIFLFLLDLPSNATSKILSNCLTNRNRDTMRKTEVVVRLTNYGFKCRTFSKKQT